MATVSFTLPYCLFRSSWSQEVSLLDRTQKTKITESLPGAASQPTGLQGILQGGIKSRRSTSQRTRPPLPLHRAGGEFWAVNPEGGPELWPWLQAPISPAHLLLWVCVHQILRTQRSLLFQNPSLSMQPLQCSPPQLEEECEHYCFRGHFCFRNQEVYIHMYPRYAWLTMQIDDSEHLGVQWNAGSFYRRSHPVCPVVGMWPKPA